MSGSANNASFAASAAALDHLTNTAAQNHDADPKSHLHQPAVHETSHSWLSRLFPSSSLEALEDSFHMGNYVIDRKTGEKSFEAMRSALPSESTPIDKLDRSSADPMEPHSLYVRVGMHFLYYGSQQEKALHWQTTLDLLKSQSEKMGAEYDKAESVEHIQPFIDSFSLQDTLHELVQPDPSRYTTFNHFFAREIREDARPQDEPANDLIITSPADCRLTAFPTVDLATKYWIKGFGFSISALLGDGELAKEFDGGSIVIARLAPQDYHRWHAPVSGTVKAVKEIPGAYYTVNPQAINEPGTLDVFCENRRSVMLVERTSTRSPVAIIAVGAMLVGSIKYVGGVDATGSQIRRGQCLGAFYYGGSTVIVLYPKGEFTLDGDLVKNSTEANCETLMRVGWRVGKKD